jgi:hypothetical protein
MHIALDQKRFRAASLFTVAVLLGACPGSYHPTGGRDGGSSKDLQIFWPEASKPTESGTNANDLRAYDLTATAGDPCTFGKCGANLVCLPNLGKCVKMCTSTNSTCNVKVTSCTASQACLRFSTFTDACYPATAKYLANCTNLICEQGNLCVDNGTTDKCLRLCQYGCPSGVSCVGTTNGCSVCYQ